MPNRGGSFIPAEKRPAKSRELAERAWREDGRPIATASLSDFTLWERGSDVRIRSDGARAAVVFGAPDDRFVAALLAALSAEVGRVVVIEDARALRFSLTLSQSGQARAILLLNSEAIDSADLCGAFVHWSALGRIIPKEDTFDEHESFASFLALIGCLRCRVINRPTSRSMTGLLDASELAEASGLACVPLTLDLEENIIYQTNTGGAGAGATSLLVAGKAVFDVDTGQRRGDHAFLARACQSRNVSFAHVRLRRVEGMSPQVISVDIWPHESLFRHFADDVAAAIAKTLAGEG